MKRRDFLKLPALAAIHLVDPSAEKIGLPLKRKRSTYGDKILKQRIHPDFITTLPDVEYFLLGNGDIQGVVQFCPGGEGTYVGFTIMDPHRFTRKWSTFLYHPERGFELTGIHVIINGKGYKLKPENLEQIGWKYADHIPIVSILWSAGGCKVEEEFFVPSSGNVIFRKVNIKNLSARDAHIRLRLLLYPNFGLFDEIYTDEIEKVANATGYINIKLFSLSENVEVSGRYEVSIDIGNIPPGEERSGIYVYSIKGGERILDKRDYKSIWLDTSMYWRDKNQFESGVKELDHIYNVSKSSLSGMMASNGKRDSGIWQYNMEWVRDDVMVILGLLMSGFFDKAKILLEKIFKKSIGPDGRTIESSRWFGYEYTELDQNGQLLYAVWSYLCWTEDYEFVRGYWDKIKLVAEFPLIDIFRDRETGMVRNRRESWERTDAFGVEDGYELSYQFWISLGLEKISKVAVKFGDEKLAIRWMNISRKIKNSMLNHPKFKFIEDSHFIKRRTREGKWQKFMIPPDRRKVPAGSPLAVEKYPSAEPDTTEVLPIVFGMIDPKSELSLNTLRWIEKLWNQRWDFGGYERYDSSSEPQPPGPWPIASMFVARAYTEAEDYDKVWRVVNWLYNINGGKSGGWLEYYSKTQLTPPLPPVGLVGWIWAEIIMLAIYHIIGFRPELDRLIIRPKILTGIEKINTTIKIRNIKIKLEILRSKDKDLAIINGKEVKVLNRMLSISYPKIDSNIKIWLRDEI